ncbi:MAG: SNF2-related protein, partial [Marmoricola sp.]
MGEIEFSGPARTIRMPLRGAIPVLTRAMRVHDAHPSVGLLSGATLLGLRMVAAGRVRLADTGDSWRVGPLQPEDADRVRALAAARVHDEITVTEAEELIRHMLDAVADTMTRPPPAAPAAGPRRGSRPDAARGEDSLLDSGLPAEVRISLRVEAPGEVLEGGGIVLVVQAHESGEDTHLVDASRLWSEEDHGFARRARISLGVRLREAVDVWAPLDRLQRLAVPDRIVLDSEELADLLDHGLEALDRAGIEVFWPRGLRGELTPQASVEVRSGPREAPLYEGLFGPGALFEFDWKLALGSDVLSEEEMTALANATTPVIRLRDNWMIIDPAVARRARRRKATQKLKPVVALQAALTGTLDLDGQQVEVHPGASLLRVRDRIVDAAVAPPVETPSGLHATLRDYQRHGLTWLAELTGVGLGACLADDMGLGKTITLIALHLHRRERALATGPTLVVCPASLMGNWEAEIHRFAPGVSVRRFHGATRSLEGSDGFVLTTYGTMRRDHETLAAVGWDLVVADEAQHIKNAGSSTARNLRTIESRCRVALTGTPVENTLTELWAILDWAIPGLLGSRNAFRKVWAGPIESGLEPTKARQFADLIGPFLLRRRKS